MWHGKLTGWLWTRRPKPSRFQFRHIESMGSEQTEQRKEMAARALQSRS
jgi:hypothetical protein